MKTLNRTLSLTLVFALVFSLMSFAFAADATTTSTTTGYTDATSITYKEAVDVATAIGVFQGNDSKAFAPTDKLTREQAAKIICYLTMTKAAADGLKASSAPYTDVPADRWSAGSIAYCQKQGIVSGYGDGKFGPTDTVTGYQFSKMLLVALGYDATIEQFTGVDWSINVAKRAFGNKLFAGNGNFNGNVAATREEAALYVLNMMQTKLVTYLNKGTEIIVNGTVIKQGASAPSQEGNATFMATYYSSLKLDDSKSDAFGRPANYWTYKGNEVGTYAADADFVYTSDKTDANGVAAITKDLNSYTLASGAKYYVNGDTAGSSLANNTFMSVIAGLTGNGIRVEVYANAGKQITKVTVIKTDLVKVVSVNTAAKAISLTSVVSGNSLGGSYTVSDTANSKLYAALKDLTVGTYVLVSPTKISGSWAVADVATPKTVTGYVGAVNTISKSVYVNNTAYTQAAYTSTAVTGIAVNTTTQATLYLDSYGYVVHCTNAAVNTGKNYFLVLDSYQTLVNSKLVYMAKGVYADGTVADIAIASIDSTASRAAIPGILYSVGTAVSNAYPFTTVATYGTASGATNAPASVVIAMKAGASISATDKALMKANTTGTGNYFNNYYSSGVKFIYANTTGKTATTKDGVQAVASLPTTTYAIVEKNSDMDATPVVTAVILVNGIAATASSDALLYVPSSTAAGSMAMLNKTTNTYDTISVYGGFVKGAALPTGAPIENNGALTLTGGFYTYGTDENNGSYVIAPYNLSSGTTAVKVNHKMTNTFDNRLITLGDLNLGVYKAYLTAHPGDTSGAAAAAADAGVQVDISNALICDCRLVKDQAAQPITATAAGLCQAYTDYDPLISVVYDATTNKASYVYILDRGTNRGHTLAAQAATDIKFYSNSDCTSPIADNAIVLPDTTVYVQPATNGKFVASNSLALTLLTRPNASSKAVYSFVMPASDVANNVFTEVNGISLTAPSISTVNGVVATTTLDKIYVAAGETVTVTVTVSGTATAASKITAAGETTGAALTVTSGATNLTKTSETEVSIPEVKAVSGTFTYSYTVSSTVPTFTIANA